MRLLLLSLLLGCRPSVTSDQGPPPPAAAEPTRTVEPVHAAEPRAAANLPGLLERLTLVSSMEDVWFDREGAAVCGALGRGSIPPERKAALGPLAPGSKLWVVHPGGTVALTIEDVRCDTPVEYAPAYLRAKVTWPANMPAVDPDMPYLLFHEFAPAGAARLHSPVPIAPAKLQQLAPAIRTQLEAVAGEVAADQCDDVKGRVRVAEEIQAFHVAPERLWVTAELDLDNDCVAIDHTAGVMLSSDGTRQDVAFTSQGRVDLVWLVDLDGDGEDEALIHVVELEDDSVTRSIVSCDRDRCRAHAIPD